MRTSKCSCDMALSEKRIVRLRTRSVNRPKERKIRSATLRSSCVRRQLEGPAGGNIPRRDISGVRIREERTAVRSMARTGFAICAFSNGSSKIMPMAPRMYCGASLESLLRFKQPHHDKRTKHQIVVHQVRCRQACADEQNGIADMSRFVPPPRTHNKDSCNQRCQPPASRRTLTTPAPRLPREHEYRNHAMGRHRSRLPGSRLRQHRDIVLVLEPDIGCRRGQR